jgi:hypothetical protein
MHNQGTTIFQVYPNQKSTDMRYELIIYWSKADNSFLVEVPELPGCMADGATYEEAVANAQLLPPVDGRTDFVPDQIAHRLLEIEHYYSNKILVDHDVAEPPTYPSARVFQIKDSKKMKFSQSVGKLDPAEFINFSSLFDRLLVLFGVSPPLKSKSILLGNVHNDE